MSAAKPCRTASREADCMPFGDYAAYYDLLYADKDYDGEARYVLDLLRGALGAPPATLLDLGCGTGAHARRMADLGVAVHRVDVSEGMIRLARERFGDAAAFTHADCTDFDLDRSFDAVTALFHVACYQTETRNLEAMLRRAAAHLRPGGVLLFDFWYGPAVLADPPVVRVKRMENETLRVLRIAEPETDLQRNVVDVHYEVRIRRTNGDPETVLRETHSMRYLFLPELVWLLDGAGMHIVSDHHWMRPGLGLSRESWSGALLARRRG